MNARPFTTYPGGKGSDGTYQALINLIPPHRVFISGFLGNCALMAYKRPASVNIGIDSNLEIVSAWKNLTMIDTTVGRIKPQFDFLNCKFQDYSTRFLPAWNYPDCFLYLDPPYPLKTWSSDKNKIYGDHVLSDEQHVELLRTLLPIRAMVMISTYDNPIYQRLLSHWHKVSFQSQTRKGQRTETVYMNYDIKDYAGRLHDYRYAGSNFTERQRIKRMVDRSINKLKRLPPVERQAIIEQIKSEF
jgi:DNA adenine methylase